MSDHPEGKLCPVCGKDIGTWAVVRAPAPDRIRCPHCSQRLRYGATNAVIAVLVAVYAVAAVACAVLAMLVPVHDWVLKILAFFVAYLVVMQVIEHATAAFLRRNKPLEAVGPVADVPCSEAGWYPDPTGRFGRRYWNGVAWTEHVETHGLTAQDHL